MSKRTDDWFDRFMPWLVGAGCTLVTIAATAVVLSIAFYIVKAAS